MLNVRSRAGVVALTTGAAVFLALPVVAAGQVPGVDEVVGGVEETAKGVAPAPLPALPKPTVSVPAPAPAPAPKQQNAAPAPAPSTPAPPAQRQTAPATSTGSGEGAASTSGSGSGKGGSAAGEGGPKKDRGAKAGTALGAKSANASQDGGAPTDVEIASQAVDVPEDANPSTLPFTGLQLALLGALGLMAVATGMALRRGARSAG